MSRCCGFIWLQLVITASRPWLSQINNHLSQCHSPLPPSSRRVYGSSKYPWLTSFLKYVVLTGGTGVFAWYAHPYLLDELAELLKLDYKVRKATTAGRAITSALILLVTASMLGRSVIETTCAHLIAAIDGLSKSTTSRPVDLTSLVQTGVSDGIPDEFLQLLVAAVRHLQRKQHGFPVRGAAGSQA